MDNIQKEIKELLEMYQGRRVMDTGIVANKLVSLLEQVAEKAFVEGHSKEYHNVFDGFDEWWKEQNLTFNEN